jgi:hypothetical protein
MSAFSAGHGGKADAIDQLRQLTALAFDVATGNGVGVTLNSSGAAMGRFRPHLCAK